MADRDRIDNLQAVIASEGLDGLLRYITVIPHESVAVGQYDTIGGAPEKPDVFVYLVQTLVRPAAVIAIKVVFDGCELLTESLDRNGGIPHWFASCRKQDVRRKLEDRIQRIGENGNPAAGRHITPVEIVNGG